MNKKIIAMLLAGGEGKRLLPLTEKTAKPAITIGGKQRIIDFTLTNCERSGIDTIGVLMQYKPFELNYKAEILLPKAEYLGTANAVYQNLSFIDKFSTDYVLILSGDHVYNMDYSNMLDFHIGKQADLTIAVKKVPIDDANRFGIMILDADGRITDFEEKPETPKSDTASMGIYIFNCDTLKQFLSHGGNDFGKNVIPEMLNCGAKIYGYKFDGYWKDIGTIESLWEANMDLIGDENAIISDNSNILGDVEKSVISDGVSVGKNSFITNSVIMPNAVIGENVIINYAIVGEGCCIPDNFIKNNQSIGTYI